MRFLKALLIFAILIIVLPGCDKTPYPDFTYTFENLSDKPVNVDIYATLSDYNNGTNRIMTGRADVRGYAVFPLKNFTPKQVYYVDWYSDDYQYTNWYWSNVTLTDTFTPTRDNYQFVINKLQFADPSRYIWMNGLGPTTTWKAVNAYANTSGIYTSIWSSLTPARQNVQIILHKDFSAQITAFGVDTSITYQASYNTATNQSIATLLNNDRTVFGTLASNFSAATTSFSSSPDTMLANLNGIGYYAMVRQ